MHFRCAGSGQVVIGTLDVVVTSAIEGEYLRGHDRDAAYMINVCVADVARRRGVGKQLVRAAVQAASSLGAQHASINISVSSCGFDAAWRTRA